MANLEAMRSFQRHWASYCADERRLALLCTKVPLDCSQLSADDRGSLPGRRPDSIAYDEDALIAALGAEGAREGHVPGEGSQWGWWRADDAWRVLDVLEGLAGEYAAACAELAAVAEERQRATDTDAALNEVRAKLETYRAADAAEHAELERFTAERAAVMAPLDAEAARAVPWPLRPWKRLKLWALRRFKLADALAPLDQKLMDTRAKLEVRAAKIVELEAASRARRAEVEEPYGQPLDALSQSLDAIERAVIACYDHDLSARDASYASGSLDEFAFLDACALANAREWAALDAWMASYSAQLPSLIAHMRDVVGSELVWLEGYAPYGKRYWPLTDEVLAIMEAGRADTSELALKLARG